MNWTEYFLNLAEQIKLKSKDQSTQIGAVIVGIDNEVLSTGYNSFPRGLNDNVPERQISPLKYEFIVHAEINAIVNAARAGVSIHGSTLYLSCGTPCNDCAKAIVNGGIKKIYCKKECTTKNKLMWADKKRIAQEIFFECGVEVVYY